MPTMNLNDMSENKKFKPSFDISSPKLDNDGSGDRDRLHRETANGNQEPYEIEEEDDKESSDEDDEGNFK